MTVQKEIESREVLLKIGLKEVHKRPFTNLYFLIKLPKKMSKDRALEELVDMLRARREK